MSDDPTLYLKLDGLTADGKVLDAAGAGSHGTVSGAALVPDPTFGSCLRFDGQGSHVTMGNTHLGTALSGSSTAFTITAWVQPERLGDPASNHGTRNVFLARASKRFNDNLELGISPQGNLDVYIDTERSVGRIIELGSSELAAGSWHAVAVTFESGNVTAHLDGTAYESSTPRPALAGADGSPVTLGTTLNSGIHFQGRLAHVRAYPRALTAGEIEAAMRADRTVAASSRVSQPVSFDLVDADDNAVLYITDTPGGQVANLEVRNTGTAPLALAGIPKALGQSHHFELLLRPGTIDPSDLGGLTAPAGWTLKARANQDGTASVYLAATEATSLAPGDTLRIPIGGVRAAKAGGSRGTRVVLKHQLGGTSGEVEDHVSIVSHLGKPNIPLHFGIVGSNTVLNDGTTASALHLRLTNVSKTDTITFAAGRDAPTKLVLAVDAGTDDWDLVETGQASGLQLSCPGVTIEKEAEGESPEWVVTFPRRRALGPRATLDFALGGIVTGLPTGPSQIYLHYENVPGYWDGDRVVIAEKTPVVMRKDGVGINTAPAPGLSLHVQGETDAQVLYAENLPSGRRGHAGHFRGGQGVLIDAVSGKRNALSVSGETNWALTQSRNAGSGAAGYFVGKSGVLVNISEGSGYGLNVSGSTNADLVRAENTGSGPSAHFRGGSGLVVDGVRKGPAADFRGAVRANHLAVTGAAVANVVAGMGTVPIGAVLPFAGAAAPPGWLLCHGQRIRSGYTNLRKVLGSDRVPDLRSNLVRGAGNRQLDPRLHDSPGTPHRHITQAVRRDSMSYTFGAFDLRDQDIPSSSDDAAAAVALNFIIYAGAERGEIAHPPTLEEIGDDLAALWHRAFG